MSGWTAERMAVLRRMHAEGASQAVIGAALGISANAVSQQARRVGLARRPRAVLSAILPAAQAVVVATPLPPGARTLPRLGDPAPPAPLADVVYRTCRYIPGAPAGAATVFCDAPVLAGSCYCPAHHARCFVRKAAAA